MRSTKAMSPDKGLILRPPGRYELGGPTDNVENCYNSGRAATDEHFRIYLGAGPWSLALEEH